MGGVGGRGGGGGGGALFEAQRAHRVGATRVGRRGWRTAVSGCSTTSNALMLFLSTHLSSHTFVASPSFTPFRTHLYPLWSPACPPDWRLNTATFRLKLSPESARKPLLHTRGISQARSFDLEVTPWAPTRLTSCIFHSGPEESSGASTLPPGPTKPPSAPFRLKLCPESTLEARSVGLAVQESTSVARASSRRLQCSIGQQSDTACV